MTTLGRRALLAAIVGGALAARARANAAAAPPPEVGAALPGARLQGEGRLRFLGLHIYDARLWTPGEVKASDWTAATLALELHYGRSLDGPKIAERSLAEMRRQGEIDPAQAAPWLAAMAALFPDVAEGDRLSAILLQPGQPLRFFANGVLRGEGPGGDFTRRFLGIWLAPQTSEPALRQALLGRAGA